MKVVNGHIINGTSICVDYWQWTPEEKYHHFLTHLHADHTVNLKSTFREKIYTSPFNAWLLRRWFNISPELIVPLSVGDSHLVYDPNTDSRFSVTLLDANHCPGSVMFLFQGDFGNILYTGDFRYDPEILQHPMLKSLIENEAVDKLYLDNTFAAEHCEFPPRQQALRDVINLIKDHPDHNILLGVRKLGKEEVLRGVALELKEKICVSNEKLRILTKLGYQSVFTTDSEDARIFVKEMPHITPRLIDQLRAERGPVVTILLTALYSVISPHVKYSINTADRDKGIYKIPYSDHSCHSELIEFVSTIKPKEIFPIVSSSAGNKVNLSQGSELSEILSCTWQNSVIPKSILTFSGNPDNLGVVVIPVSQNDSMSSVKENAVSYITEDSSETSSENIIGTPKGVEASKAKTPEKVEHQTDSSEDVTRSGNENLEIISQRSLSPTVCISQRKSQVACFSPKLMNPDCITGLDIREESQEFFTMSDEDLSQLNVASDQQYIANKQNLTITEVLGDSNVIMKNVQTVCEENEDSQSPEKVEDQIDSSEGGTRIGNENLETISQRSLSPTVCISQRKSQVACFSPKLMNPDCITGLDIREESQEFFTMSDEDLSQLNVASDQQYIANKQNLTITEVLGHSNVIMKNIQTVCEENKDFQSNNVSSDLISSHQPLEDLVNSEKHVSFTPYTPPSTHKCKFVKKHLPTPLPKAKYTSIAEDDENESYGCENSDTKREENEFDTSCDSSAGNDMRINDNIPHSTRNLVCDFESHQNVAEIGDFQDLNLSTTVSTNKATLFTEHPSTLVPKDGYEENPRNGRPVEKLNDRRETHYEARNVTPDAMNCMRTHINGQDLANSSFCETITEQFKKGNQAAQWEVGRQVVLNSSSPFPQNKSKMLKKHLPTHMLINNFLTEENVDKENKSLTLPDTKTFRDKHFLKKTNNNRHLKTENSLADTRSSLINHISDKNKVISDRRVLASKSELSKGNISRLMPTTANQSNHFYANDSLQNNSSDTKLSNTVTSTTKGGNQFCEDEKIENEIGAGLLKRIFLPQIPTAEQNNKTDSWLQKINTSVQKLSIEDTSVPNVGNQFDDDEKRKNEIRVAILKRIFTPQLPTAKQNVRNNGQTDSCLQKISTYVQQLSIEDASVPKVGNQFERNEKIKNGNARSTLKQIVHSHLPHVVTRRDVVDGGQTDNSVQDSSCSDSDVSVQLTKLNRKKREDLQGGSDSTDSDLEDNWMTLEKFETLDRRNDQICESRDTHFPTSKCTRISEKFEHLLVKEFPNKSSSSGFFCPTPKTELKRTCMVVSSLAQNDEVSRESNSQSCLSRRPKKGKSPVIKDINCLQDNSHKITKLKGIRKRNYLESHNHVSPTKKPRKEIEGFCEDFLYLYDCWKEAVMKSCEKQTTSFQQGVRADTQLLK